MLLVLADILHFHIFLPARFLDIYVPHVIRQLWFRSTYPKGQIKTKMLNTMEDLAVHKYCLFAAEVYDNEQTLLAVGHGSANVEEDSFFEAAERRAVSKALANAGFTWHNGNFCNDDDIAKMQKLQMPSDRIIQDYKSTYNDIRDWLRRKKEGKKPEKSRIDWDDVIFEMDLLKSQEINLDYILELIFENNKKKMDKSSLIDEIRRVIRSSVGNRAKESLIVDFIHDADLDAIPDRTEIIKAFFEYAQTKQKKEASDLIASENLNEREAKHYIEVSLRREYASDNGTDFNNILPKMSPLNPLYLTKKNKVFEKIAAFVEKFKGVGGKL